MSEDEGRAEQKSSYRIKLFKETHRAQRTADPTQARSPREDWDRRQSLRTQATFLEDESSLSS
jgi:hypothetical protein